jgi:hypothetical protein
MRSWRIVLNLAGSWLSREIVLFSSFVLAGTACLWFRPDIPTVGWLVTILGFDVLIAVDMVYRYAVRREPNLPHSASVFLTGLLLAGVLAGNPALAGTAGTAKLILYLRRKIPTPLERSATRWLIGGARLGIGLVLPALLWGIGQADLLPLVTLVTLGEVIDRLEYYVELEVMTPKLQMAEDLARMLDRDRRLTNQS